MARRGRSDLRINEDCLIAHERQVASESNYGGLDLDDEQRRVWISGYEAGLVNGVRAWGRTGNDPPFEHLHNCVMTPSHAGPCEPEVQSPDRAVHPQPQPETGDER